MIRHFLLLFCLLPVLTNAQVRQYSTNPFDFGLGSDMPTPRDEGMQEREAIEREYRSLYAEQPENFARRLEQKVAYRTYKKRIKNARAVMMEAMQEATLVPTMATMGGVGIAHIIKTLLKNPNVRHTWSKVGLAVGGLGGLLGFFFQHKKGMKLRREIDALNTVLQLDNKRLYEYIQDLQTTLNLAAIGLPDPFYEDKDRVYVPKDAVAVMTEFQEQSFDTPHEAILALRADLVPLIQKRLVKLRRLSRIMTPLNSGLLTTGILNLWDLPYTGYDHATSQEQARHLAEISDLKRQIAQYETDAE